MVNNVAVLHGGLPCMIREAGIAHALAINVKAPLTAMRNAARLINRARPMGYGPAHDNASVVTS